MYITKGKIHLIIENTKITVNTNEFILINGNIMHSLIWESDDDYNFLTLMFSFVLNEDGSDMIRKLYMNIHKELIFVDNPSYFILNDSIYLTKELHLIYNELILDNIIKQYYIQNLFCSALLKITRLYDYSNNTKLSLYNRHVKKAIRYIHNNYQNDIQISNIAEHVNLNISYFYEIFKESTGKTPLEYLNSVRIEKAKYYLLRGESNVLDIALSVGYNSRHQFLYNFKNLTGYTPRKYKLLFEDDNKFLNIRSSGVTINRYNENIDKNTPDKL